MPGTVRTVRISLTYAAAALWVTGVTAAALWTAGIDTDTTPRLLSVDLTAAATCTVGAMMCWLTAVLRNGHEELLIKTVADATRRAVNARNAPTMPLRRVR